MPLLFHDNDSDLFLPSSQYPVPRPFFRLLDAQGSSISENFNNFDIEGVTNTIIIPCRPGDFIKVGTLG